MCCSCKNKENLKEALLNALAELKSEKDRPYQEHSDDYECPQDTCACDEQEVNEQIEELSELLQNAHVAISQIQDMVEEVEETLDDIKEAMGHAQEDLDEAVEIIEDLE